MTEKQLNTLNSGNQLINVSEVIIDCETVNSVDARDLHLFLESGQNFADWIKNRIEKYEFIEGIDFITNHNGMFSPPRKDYNMVIDMAMVISANERNKQGAKAYKYFCEVNGYQVVLKHQKRMEYQFGQEIIDNLFSEFEVISQYPVFGGKYRIDWYIPELKLAIEFDEPHHFKQIKEDSSRRSEIERELGCKFAIYDQR